MIKIICIGKLKEKYLQDMVKEYEKRISKYTKVKIIELEDKSFDDINKIKKIEAEEINKQINEKDFIITLDILGKQMDSIELANYLYNTQMNFSNITFIIGGSYGLSDGIRNKANLSLSFSKLTFPHQLFRVMLLEQLYRCYKIQNNEIYHK